MNFRFVLRLLPVLVLACLSLPAQSLAGLAGLNGSVRDASGAVIPAATVTVRNSKLGITRSLETNASGLFAASSLPPSDGYEVVTGAAGFANWEMKNIELQVGQNLALNITLKVSTQVTEVTVAASVPLVDELKTGVSQVVNSNQIQELPVNGRRVDSFVLLSPGVDADGTFGLLSFRGTAGGNAFLTDGNDTTQGYYNENAGRTRISSNLSQDAVQEFQVQTSGMTAEFGRAVGGSVNTVTRSGTNSVHGTGYWFWRNQDLNARDRYALTNPPELRNQFGGSVGGPIKSNKLFYFLNADFTRRDFPLYSTAQNPTLFTPTGVFIGTCGTPATPTQCQNAINYFQRFFGIIPRTANQDTYFAKMDWRPTDQHAISASFNLMNWVSPNGIQTQATLTNAGGVGNNGDSTVRHRFARLAWTYVPKSNLVNEFRFGWFKDRLYDYLNGSLAPPNGLLGQLTVAGQSNLGVAVYLPRVQPTEDRYQFADSVSWLTGKHNFKFGVDFTNTTDTIDLLNQGRGAYTYATFTNFALDYTNLDGGKRWQTYQQTFGNPTVSLYVRDYAFFAQDQWKLSKRFTLNYGIRYEYAQFQQPTVFNPDYPGTKTINQPGLNFAPRVGISYALDNSGKTVLRSGFGMFYARMPGAVVGNIMQSNGILQTDARYQSSTPGELAAGPVFPSFLSGTSLTPPLGSVGIGYPASDLASPYTMQWDFAIEREITRTTGLTVSYLGSRGVKFFMTRDLNIGAEGPSVTYRILDTAGADAGTYSTPTYLLANRVDKRYNRVNILEGNGQTWYNGLVVQLRQRAGRWFQGTLAYTWSHAEDFNQGGGSNNLFFLTDSVRTVFNGDFKGQKGNSILDLRQRVVVTGMFNPTNIRSDNWAVKSIINGWQLSMIGTFTATRYTTPTMQVSNNFTGAAYNNTLNGFGGDFRVPFIGRSSVPIDAVDRLDARITKQFSFSERWKLNAGFEAFNVFNHVSNTSVVTQMYTARNLVLTPSAGMGTGTASQGFPDGTNARRCQVMVRLLF